MPGLQGTPGPRGYPGPGGVKGEKGEPANVDWTNYEKGQKGEVNLNVVANFLSSIYELNLFHDLAWI